MYNIIQKHIDRNVNEIKCHFLSFFESIFFKLYYSHLLYSAYYRILVFVYIVKSIKYNSFTTCHIHNGPNEKPGYLLVCHCPLAVFPLFESTVQSGDHERTAWRQQLVGHIHTTSNGDLDS